MGISDGWDCGVPKVRIRLAKAADVPSVAEMAPLAGEGVELESPLAGAITEGFVGAALRVGFEDGAGTFHRRLAGLLSQPGGTMRAYLNAALVLVAEHSAQGIVGTLLAYPPISLIAQYRADPRMWGASPLAGVADLVKIKAVVVSADVRRAGIASQMLRRCRQVFFRCDYKILYGQMELSSPELEYFYRKCGFTVLEADEAISLWPIFGFNAQIGAPGQRLFFRERTGPSI